MRLRGLDMQRMHMITKKMLRRRDGQSVQPDGDSSILSDMLLTIWGCPVLLERLEIRLWGPWVRQSILNLNAVLAGMMILEKEKIFQMNLERKFHIKMVLPPTAPVPSTRTT